MASEESVLKREMSANGENDGMSGESIQRLKTELLQLDSQLDQAYEQFSSEQEELCCEASYLESMLETVHHLTGIESVLIEGATVLVCFAKPITLPGSDETHN